LQVTGGRWQKKDALDLYLPPTTCHLQPFRKKRNGAGIEQEYLLISAPFALFTAGY
jgi:hypothetical protein